MKLKKPVKIGENELAASTYALHKGKKLQHYNLAKEYCSKFIEIAEEDKFKYDFLKYTFDESKVKMNLPYIEQKEWAKIIGFDLLKLQQIQKNYDTFSNVSLLSTATEADHSIYLTTEHQQKLHLHLQKIVAVLNEKPEFTCLFFNVTNQFTNCLKYDSIECKAIINPIWICNQLN